MSTTRGPRQSDQGQEMGALGLSMVLLGSPFPTPTSVGLGLDGE